MTGQQPNVYVVDDDGSIREAAAALMRSAGLRVETFPSAQEAWERAQTEIPDCMVLDVHLPGISGLEFQEKLIKERIHFPIIFMTGEGDIPMSVRAMKAGAHEFLTKPFNNEYILQSIRQAVANDRRRRESEARASRQSADREMVNSAAAENRRLLREILPDGIAAELRQKGSVEPAFVPDAAVIFTDFERFSETAALLPPSEMIGRLHAYFSDFDGIVAAHGLEKIKTIGDSYMAVGGVPSPHADPVRAACDAALEIMDSCRKISGNDGWKIRIGVHVGPLVAGVIGKHKFSYDVWGETVNLASRMESCSTGGRINVSSFVHARAQERYNWEKRGVRPIKGRGPMEMYYLLGKRPLM